MQIAHVYQLYAMQPEDFRRYSVARRSWYQHLYPHVLEKPFEITSNTRTADKLVQDARDVPYVNDMIDAGFSDAAVDAVMFTNSDIGFITSPVEYLTQQLNAVGCAWLRRLDYNRLTEPPKTTAGGVIGGGADLFAVTRDWWERNKTAIPLMFVGTEGFDFVLLAAMYRSGALMKNQPNLLFHERHGSYWKKDKSTLIHSPAQSYNRSICAAWARANGFAYMINPAKNSFLFRELKNLKPVVRKEFDLGIVVLGRYGDIINTLPIAKKYADYGQRIAWGVAPEYASIFDGVGYVTPIIIKTRLSNVAQAVRELRRSCSDVQAWQMYGNATVGRRRTSSFAMEMWRMAGATDEFMNLPLVFDRRDYVREQSLVQKVIGNTVRPLLFSGIGTSSPFAQAAACFSAVKQIADKYDCPLIDISRVSAHRIYDMLGVFEASRGLVVIDSAYLHLTYASGTPTFALTSEGPVKDKSLWYGSQPRAQWCAKASYSNWAAILPEIESWFIRSQSQKELNYVV